MCCLMGQHKFRPTILSCVVLVGKTKVNVCAGVVGQVFAADDRADCRLDGFCRQFKAKGLFADKT
jgi:hypothetical protein